MLCLCFVIQYYVSVQFCNHLDREERADSQCFVARPLGAVDWYAVCDCGIS